MIGDKIRKSMTIVRPSKENILVLLIILAVGTCYLITIREGHDWGGDFSMYIHHAKNLAEGNHYDNTGYVYNPSNPFLGPKTYPPIFPLILSPIYKSFGLNLTAMKVVVILFFLASLWIFFLAFTHELSFEYVLAIIIVIAFNPYFWSAKDKILSDIPFLFFAYVSLFFIYKIYDAKPSLGYHTLYAILLGCSIYLSYGTRSVGLVLIGSFLIHDTIRHRRISEFAIITFLTFISFGILQNTLLHNDSSYVDAFRLSTYSLISQTAYWYVKSLRLLWENGYSILIANLVYISMSVLMIIGYVTRLKERTTIFEIFPLVYLGVVIVFPRSLGMRGLIPVIPLYILFSFVGIRYLGKALGRKWERVIVMVCMAVVISSYIAQFTKKNYGPIEYGVGRWESKHLFEFVRSNTEKNDVLMFRKPRVLSLFTGRRAGYVRVKNGEELLGYLAEVDAKYVIVETSREVFGGDKVMSSVVEEYEDMFKIIYSNLEFEIYRFDEEGRGEGTGS